MPTNSTEAAHLGFTTFLLSTDPDENGVSYPFLWHQTARASVFNDIADDDIEARNAAAAKAAEDAVSLALAFGNAFMAVGGKTVTDRGDGLLEFVEVTEEDDDGNVVTHSVVKVSKFPDWVPTANAQTAPAPAAPAAPAAPSGSPSAPQRPAAKTHSTSGPTRKSGPSAPSHPHAASDEPIKVIPKWVHTMKTKDGSKTYAKITGQIYPDGPEISKKGAIYVTWDVLKDVWPDFDFTAVGDYELPAGLLAECSRQETNPKFADKVLSIGPAEPF